MVIFPTKLPNIQTLFSCIGLFKVTFCNESVLALNALNDNEAEMAVMPSVSPGFHK